jgi:hypothetical protein
VPSGQEQAKPPKVFNTIFILPSKMANGIVVCALKIKSRAFWSDGMLNMRLSLSGGCP